MSEKSSPSGGIGVFGLLGVLFVALKLLNYITWSWWWVLLPFYWWIFILIVPVVGVLIFEGTKEIASWIRTRKTRKG